MADGVALEKRSPFLRSVGSNPTLSAIKLEGCLDNNWLFYIVKCRDGSLYSGITNNIEKRLQQHNAGKGAKYTSGRRPVTLVYSESCIDISAARIRELQVKNFSRIKKTNLINGF